MQKAKLILLALVFTIAVPCGAAIAAQEQLIHSKVSVGYWDIWKHTNGEWQDEGEPGQSAQYSETYTIPDKFLDEYKITRITTSSPKEFSEQDYNIAGKYWDFKGNKIEYNDFMNRIYGPYIPKGYSVLGSPITSTGDITVERSFILNPTQLENGKKAIDLKASANRHIVDLSDREFAQAAEGWRWYQPVLIKWYGVPKGVHDLQFTDRTPQLFGDLTTGNQVDGNISIKNLSNWPTLAQYTQFRVYIQEEGGQPLMVSSAPLSLGGLEETDVSFGFRCPGNKFKLILTANMYYNGRWVEENLRVFKNGNPISKPEEEYLRNKVVTSLTPSIGGDEDTGGPSNLAVTGLQLLNENGNPVSGTVMVNEQYKVKATFKSTFDSSGVANVRFYLKRESGSIQFKDCKNVMFSPNGTKTETWNMAGMGEDVSLMATVAYKWWEQQDKWKKEPFDGKEETIYDDNIMMMDIIGTDAPDGPPTPGSWFYPVYYPPMTEQWVPITEEKEVLKTTPGWVQVPFIPDDKQAELRYRITE
ncbi:MAG: hypothetical protein FH756_10845 [Firmicutes bacterium]|nr:hypothetical protein [Bacillota bacterium]